jgi:peptidoglycan/LPS O-acetylase OafA/YrhL
MFFVLSGFLITRILIQSKLKDQKIGRSHWFSVKQFIIRRSIRIFPIYFLTIFVLYALNVPPVRDTIGWCLLYVTNFYIALNQHWMGTIDHLWSLAVEEQYYLFFPYLILFLPTKHYLKMLGILIFISIALRIWLYLNHTPWMVQYVLMPTCLDCFGLGGLMAYYFTFKKETIFNQLTKTIYLIISLISYIVILYITRQHQLATNETHNVWNTVIERFVSSVFCFFLIAKAIEGYSGGMKWFLTNPISSYLGRISYGLYLYHNFVYNVYHTASDSIVLRGLRKIKHLLPILESNTIFELLYFFAITATLATLSWYLVEKPINNLKKYFTY